MDLAFEQLRVGCSRSACFAQHCDFQRVVFRVWCKLCVGRERLAGKPERHVPTPGARLLTWRLCKRQCGVLLWRHCVFRTSLDTGKFYQGVLRALGVAQDFGGIESGFRQPCTFYQAPRVSSNVLGPNAPPEAQG